MGCAKEKRGDDDRGGGEDVRDLAEIETESVPRAWCRVVEELQALQRAYGAQAAIRNSEVLSELLRWLRQSSGHGDVKLSAVKHVLGSKFRVDCVITARREGRES